MFVLSMKTTRPRLAACGAVLGLLLAVMAVTGTRHQPVVSVAAGGDDAARVSYLQEQGYAVESQWVDVRELSVPDTDAVPTAYRGKRVKCFTYVTADGAYVCLYEYNGKIVGARPQSEE